MAVSPKPSGYHDVTPYLIVDGAAGAIAFYEQAFGAKERMRMAMAEDKIGHAELQIGDTVVMLADEYPDMGITGPRSRGGTTVSFLLYVPNVDEDHLKAVEAGAKILRPLADQFYGDRTVTLEDPFGHQWTLATHVEDVDEEELMRRFAAMTAGCSDAS